VSPVIGSSCELPGKPTTLKSKKIAGDELSTHSEKKHSTVVIRITWMFKTLPPQTEKS
jgi:hypothetical protein